MSKKTIRPFFLSIAGFCLALFLKLYFKTLRVTFDIPQETKKELMNGNNGAIIMVWHDGLFLLPLFRFLGEYRTSSVLISNSRDGDLPAAFTRHFKGFHALRVKASARHKAAKEAPEALHRKEGIFLTPDGPKGPRHVVKGGTYFLSQKTGASLFAFGWKASSCFSLSTWDRFRIPLPFSRIKATLLGPIPPEEIAIEQAMGKTNS